MLTEEKIRELVALAAEAREKAYVPYSHYPVGAAVLFASGKIYTGCNVENASYGLTNCGERTAIFKGVSEGEREILAVAISVKGQEAGSPCGACRQVIREFGPKAVVISAAENGNYFTKTLEELLPHSFGPEYLAGS
ncbi:MAG TPA: cytidine deaminase [Verrucomicrobiae bacterium]|nr:cytidine deaminase [Verrucomicrobiae bacterium]